jgi:hypothetical protein
LYINNAKNLVHIKNRKRDQQLKFGSMVEKDPNGKPSLSLLKQTLFPI